MSRPTDPRLVDLAREATDYSPDVGAAYVVDQARRAGIDVDRTEARGLIEAARVEVRQSRPGRESSSSSTHDPARPRIPEPWTMAALREMPEPEERWHVAGAMAADSNFLLAGYPKTHKTNLVLELGVSLVTGTPFIRRFRVPERRRVGLVLFEDAKHRVRRRLERMAMGRGLTLRDLDGLFFWFRPPLRLSSAADLAEMAGYVQERELDYLHIDNWAYVASGNSNDADDVTPQLQGLSRLRDVRDGLTVGLTQHARKTTQDAKGDRLTDLIRNSSAFGAWYDQGWVLSRSDEQSPVKVRCEMRDYPAPEPFLFTVRDQYPAGPDSGPHPSGWMRLEASDRSPAVVEREVEAARFVPAVREYLEKHDGCSKSELRRGITGDNALILAAFDVLCEAGQARYIEPEKRGMAGHCELTPLNPAGTPLGAGSRDNPADPAVEGGSIRPPYRGAGSRAGQATSTSPAGSTDSPDPLTELEADDG